MSYDLPIGGIVPFSTNDFPGETSFIVFTQGCNYNCIYCHNHELKDFTFFQTFNDIFIKIKERSSFIDAVVFSGGEPTIHREKLITAVKKVKDLNLKVGLHTSGSNPDLIEKLIPFLDWVGLDIKASPLNYKKMIGHLKTKESRASRDAWKTFRLLINNNIKMEVRTTIIWNLWNNEQIIKFAKKISLFSSCDFFVQEANGQPHNKKRIDFLEKNKIKVRANTGN